MPIIKEVKNTVTTCSQTFSPCCELSKPSQSEYGIGTEWVCDTCKRQWILVGSPDPREAGVKVWTPK